VKLAPALPVSSAGISPLNINATVLGPVALHTPKLTSSLSSDTRVPSAENTTSPGSPDDVSVFHVPTIG
jgi:hypothetical protein